MYGTLKKFEKYLINNGYTLEKINEEYYDCGETYYFATYLISKPCEDSDIFNKDAEQTFINELNTHFKEIGASIHNGGKICSFFKNDEQVSICTTYCLDLYYVKACK